MSSFEVKVIIPLDMVERGIKALKAWRKRNEKESSQETTGKENQGKADGDGQDEDA